MRILIVLFVVLSLVSCNKNTSHNSKDIILCKCEEKVDVTKSDQPISKEVFTYFVSSKEGKKCCMGKIIPELPAYKEIWTNQAPKHPKVWGMNGDKMKLSPNEAMELGCSLKDGIVSIHPYGVARDYLEDEYPELKKLTEK